jgi:hypothetical protein
MSKPIVRQWMREEYAEGKLDNLSAEVVAILKAETEARKEVSVPSVFSNKKVERLEEEA